MRALYNFTLYRPGIADYDRRTDEPLAFAPEVEQFEADSHTEALNIGFQKFQATGLGRQGHFNVGLA